jgi:hypothetical protein
MAGLALALFVCAIIAVNAMQPADKALSRRSAGHDFLAFYTAGTFVRTGRSSELYDLPAVRAFQQELVAREGVELNHADDFGPFWNPPIFAWVFAPLSMLPYATAGTVWTVINLCCLVGAITILCRILGGGFKTWGLVPLLVLTSMPLLQSIGHGQNTCISLLLLTATVALWRSNKSLAAGMVAGLLFYKPQLGAIVAAGLILSRGWRALAGLAITGSAMLLINLITLPGTLTAFLKQLAPNVAFMQIERPYHWERHVTLKGFWRLLMQGHDIGPLAPLTTALWIASMIALLLCVAAVMLKLRRDADDLARDRIISLTIIAMPLLMPFYFDYDLLLLAVPATLLARQQIAIGSIDRSLTAAWCVLFGWLMINSAVAGATRINGTVIGLSVIAAISIVRAMQSTAVMAIESSPREPLRHAA